MNLQGKVCVVTGAASGIGEAVARAFAAAGAAGVVVADMNAEKLAKVAGEIGAQPADRLADFGMRIGGGGMVHGAVPFGSPRD